MTSPDQGVPGPWAQAAAALLEPGERLLAAEEMRTAGGVAPPPPEPESGTPLTPLGKAGTAFLHLLSLNDSPPGSDLLDRLLFGVAAAGLPGSFAGSLFHTVLHAPGVRETVLVATDRRLLVGLAPKVGLFSWADQSHDRLDPIWTAPRTVVSAAAVHRYRLRRRLVITFGDGSWGAFTTPAGESIDPARRLAAALALGTGGRLDAR